MTGETLPSALVRELVLRALREDLVHQDVTTDALFDRSISARATVVSEEPDDLILAGLDVAFGVFAEVDPDLIRRAEYADGDRLPSRAVILTVKGTPACWLATGPPAAASTAK